MSLELSYEQRDYCEKFVRLMWSDTFKTEDESRRAIKTFKALISEIAKSLFLPKKKKMKNGWYRYVFAFQKIYPYFVAFKAERKDKPLEKEWSQLSVEELERLGYEGRAKINKVITDCLSQMQPYNSGPANFQRAAAIYAWMNLDHEAFARRLHRSLSAALPDDSLPEFRLLSDVNEEILQIDFPDETNQFYANNQDYDHHRKSESAVNLINESLVDVNYDKEQIRTSRKSNVNFVLISNDQLVDKQDVYFYEHHTFPNDFKRSWLDPLNPVAIPFFERENEVEILNEFISDQSSFKFVVVKGQSGSGKTRLISEWINANYELLNWDIRHIGLSTSGRIYFENRNRELCRNQGVSNLGDDWSNYTLDKPTLFIIDHDYGYSDIIEGIFNQFSGKHKQQSTIVRLIVSQRYFDATSPSNYNLNWRPLLNSNRRLHSIQGYASSSGLIDLDTAENSIPLAQKIMNHRAITVSKYLRKPIQKKLLEEASSQICSNQDLSSPLAAALFGEHVGKHLSCVVKQDLFLNIYLNNDIGLPWLQSKDKKLGFWTGFFVFFAGLFDDLNLKNSVTRLENYKIVELPEISELRASLHSYIGGRVSENIPSIQNHWMNISFSELFLEELAQSEVSLKAAGKFINDALDEASLECHLRFIDKIESLYYNLHRDHSGKLIPFERSTESISALLHLLRPDRFRKNTLVKWVINVCHYRMYCRTNSFQRHDTVITFETAKRNEDDEKYIIIRKNLRFYLKFSFNPRFLLSQWPKKYPDYALKIAFALLNKGSNNKRHVRKKILLISNIIRKTRSKFNPIISVLETRDNTLLRMFINASYPTNLIEDDISPLILSATGKWYNLQTETLLKGGADAKLPNSKGITAMHIAFEERNFRIIPILKLYGGDINAGDKTQTTPLMYFLRKCHPQNDARLYLGGLAERNADLHAEFIKFAIAHGADVNRRENFGGTALHLAVWYNLPSCCNMLLAKGADMCAQGNRFPMSMTPLEMISFRNHSHLFEIFSFYSWKSKQPKIEYSD